MDSQGNKLRIILPVVVGVAVLGAIVAWAVMQSEKPNGPPASGAVVTNPANSGAAATADPNAKPADRALLIGKWKDSKDAILQIRDDGSANLPLVMNKSFPVNIENINGTAIVELEARISTSWELTGNNLLLIGKGVDKLEIKRCKLDSPDFEKKFGEEKSKQMQQQIAGQMADQFGKSFVGTRIAMQIVKLDNSNLQLKDSSGEITTLTRAE